MNSNSMLQRLLLVVFFLFAFPKINAQELDAIPGLIPLNAYRPAAADLEYQNQQLSVLEAEELKKQGVDLSILDPQPSDLWRPEGFVTNSSLLPATTYIYVTNKDSRPGNFRFVARDPQSGLENSFFISKLSSNLLLRKALLAKLGYHVGEAQRKPRLELQFANTLEKEAFLSRLSSSTLGAKARWVVAEEAKKITLQDVVQTEETEFYNLSFGTIPPAIVQNRRVLNSLIIPYALVETPESINMWRWDCGVLLSNYAQLSYPESSAFRPSMEDAQWILRRLSQLQRSDFIDIVKQAQLPQSVSQLVLEKLISRRNTLLSIFKIKSSELPFDFKVTLAPQLQDGKLIHQEWSGYGTRFTFGDIESPIRAEEMGYMLQGRLQSEVFGALMNEFSQKFLANTNINAELEELQKKKINDMFWDYLLTGEVKEQELGLMSVPFVNSRLILQRNLIVGKFFGTDQMVNLSDTFGFTVGGGIYANVVGLPNGLGGSLTGQAYFNRFFSHIRPVQSVKLALRTPFKNIFVPGTLHSISQDLNEILGQDPTFFESDEGKKVLRRFFDNLDTNLGVGESMIVSDTVGGGLDGTLKEGFNEVIAAQAQFNLSQNLLRRFHIYRASAEKLQIFEDKGNIRSFSPGFTITAARVPIFEVSFLSEKAKADIEIHELDLTNDLQLNKSLLENLNLLGSLVKGERPDLLDEKKILTLQHEMKNKVFQAGLFVFQARSQKLDDRVTAIHPKGDKRVFFRRDSVQLDGMDYENFILNSANAAIVQYMGGKYQLSGGQSPLEPSNTLGGQSHIRGASIEEELGEKTGTEEAAPVLSVQEEWRGWKISRSQLEKKMKMINAEVGQVIFPSTFLGSTEAVELYQLSFRLAIYQKGQIEIINMTESKLKQILKKAGTFYNHQTGPNTPIDKITEITNIFLSRKKQYRSENNPETKAKILCDLANYLRGQITFMGLVEAAGGEKNVYAQGRITGYRINDEGTDQLVISHSFGVIGQKRIEGPLKSFLQKYQIPSSEQQALWLVDRI